VKKYNMNNAFEFHQREEEPLLPYKIEVDIYGQLWMLTENGYIF